MGVATSDGWPYEYRVSLDLFVAFTKHKTCTRGNSSCVHGTLRHVHACMSRRRLSFTCMAMNISLSVMLVLMVMSKM